MKRKKKERVIIKYLTVAIPLMLIWIIINIYNLNMQKENIKNNLIERNELTDSNTASLIDKYMEEIVENLKVVRDSNEFTPFFKEESEISKEELSALFSRFMKNKKEYNQIRYINEKGQEILRANNNGEITAVMDGQEEDKSEYAHFSETMSLAFDEVFISSLELNVENRSQIKPYEPVVSFATPIYAGNRKKGIIVINYNAKYFIDLLEKHDYHEKINEIGYFIVNKDGGFIIHQNPEKNFSYMKKEYIEINFKEINGEAWEKIKNSESGTFAYGNEFITYYNVLKNVYDKHPGYSEKWIAIHQIDIGDLNSIQTIIKETFLGWNLIIIILLNIFALILALITNKLQKKDNQLEITQKIASSTTDGIMITNELTKILYVNMAYEKITGYLEKEVLGKQPRDFKSGKQDDKFYNKMWETINEQGFWEGMLWDKKKNGVLYPQKMKVIAIKDKFNIVHHYISIFSDISLKKLEMDTMTNQDYNDSNFLIPNEDMMFQLLKQSVEDELFDFMILYVAIENFNQLINTFPEFEKTSTEQFMILLRTVIKKDDFVAQTGRNTFAVVVEMRDKDRNAEEYAKLIHKKLSNLIEFEDQKLFFKTKIGISYWPDDTNNLKRLLMNSSIALEWCRTRQTADIAFFNEHMLKQINIENEIEIYLRQALSNHEFYLVYQPQVEIKTNKVVGLEALIRWENIKLGNVAPSIFIPIAEKNNTIIDIGYWIIEQVCKDLKKINNYYGVSRNKIKCAINLSAIQMEQKEFLDIIFSIFDIYGIERTQIEMELTENMILVDNEENIKILDALRMAGMTVAIDDFGTGYSSLSYLNVLPIDKIKIDRGFIKDYPIKDDGKLVKILVMMAETLGKEVIIEGVETLEQVKFIQEIGCKYIQGYYYSKPLELEELFTYLGD